MSTKVHLKSETKANSEMDHIMRLPFGKQLLMGVFLLLGKSDFPYTGDFHGRKWPPNTNTEVQASSTEKAVSANI